MFISSLLFALLPLTVASVLYPRQPGYLHKSSSTSISVSTASSTAVATPTPFEVLATRSASPIHLQTVNAAQGGFYIGRDSNGYCPPECAPACANGSYTAFSINNGECFLDVQIPGGQTVFVLPNGQLGFTVPHSGAYPPGAVTIGFANSPGPTYGSFVFTGLGSTGWVACPTDKSTGPYQVYAHVIGFVPPTSYSCIGFNGLTFEAMGPGAFEYF